MGIFLYDDLINRFQVVGWYRTGSLLPKNEDETITKTMHEHKEATILLKV